MTTITRTTNKETILKVGNGIYIALTKSTRWLMRGCCSNPRCCAPAVILASSRRTAEPERSSSTSREEVLLEQKVESCNVLDSFSAPRAGGGCAWLSNSEPGPW